MPALLTPARALVTLALTATTFATLATTSATAAGPAAGPAPTSHEGTLVQVVSDDFANGRAGYAYGLRKADRSFVTLDGLPAKARALVGSKVRVTGKSVGKGRLSTTTVTAAAPSTAEAGSATDTSSTTAVASASRRVAVVLVNFADSPTQPVTADQVRTTMFTGSQSVNAYYQDVSDGSLGVTGDVLGWFTVARPSATSCDYAAWGSAASAAATSAGTDLSAYDHVLYFWPQQSGCAWAGLGELPGRTMWINGEGTLRVLAHELGHNLGEHHASAEKCHQSGVPVPFSGAGASCSVAEYGDPFTIMGSASTYLHSNAARHHLKLLTPVDLAAGQASRVTLAPLDSTSGGTRLVRVARGDGSFLSLEYRRPAGPFETYDATAPVATGVTIRLDRGVGTRQTVLVDTVPATATYSDAPLLAGRAVTDPVSGATIRVESQSTSGAQVSVSYDGGAGTTDTTAPSTVGNLTGSATSEPAVTLQWAAATDDSGVTGYRVWRDGVHRGDTSATSYAEGDVAAGQSHTYRVAAIDAAGNVGAPAEVSVSVPQRPTVDRQAPSTVQAVTATVTSRRVVRLRWVAATDDVGVVSYTVVRSGGSKKAGRPVTRTVRATALDDRPRRGTWTWTVVARDAAGNVSQPVSVTLTV
jgi:hypothetical protein